MKNYIQKGDVLTLTAPAGGVVSGQGVKVGDLFVVASGDALEGEEFEGCTCGVFSLPKTTTQVYTQGVTIYWDGSKLTTTSTSNIEAGRVVKAAANGDAVASVRIG